MEGTLLVNSIFFVTSYAGKWRVHQETTLIQEFNVVSISNAAWSTLYLLLRHGAEWFKAHGISSSLPNIVSLIQIASRQPGPAIDKLSKQHEAS